MRKGLAPKGAKTLPHGRRYASGLRRLRRLRTEPSAPAGGEERRDHQAHRAEGTMGRRPIGPKDQMSLMGPSAFGRMPHRPFGPLAQRPITIGPKAQRAFWPITLGLWAFGPLA